jgi:hypothetical protein
MLVQREVESGPSSVSEYNVLFGEASLSARMLQNGAPFSTSEGAASGIDGSVLEQIARIFEQIGARLRIPAKSSSIPEGTGTAIPHRDGGHTNCAFARALNLIRIFRRGGSQR